MQDRRFDAIVVGAGFAGLYMLHKLRALGLAAHVFETAGDVGGTWYWNRYPGSRCDIESFLYSYSFSPELEQEWHWSERYATQPEILRYLCHVADRFNLRRDISFNTQVTAAHYDAQETQWTVETRTGVRAHARFLITAVGGHSTPHLPSMLGLDRFQGRVLYTAAWPHELVQFEGERVGVVGTGSSGVQVIPQLARQARHLTVFQRTANYSLPAQNRRLERAEIVRIKGEYRTLRQRVHDGVVHGGGDVLLTPEQRKSVASRAAEVSAGERANAFEAGWARGGVLTLCAFSQTLRDPETNAAAADFIRSKIRQIVQDPAVAEKLSPKGLPVGAKRICIDTGYFETFNRSNVALIDVREDPIEGLTEAGVRLVSGRCIELNSLVLATGFDMITGPLIRLNITGLNGLRLVDYWAQGPRSYLGLGMAGFPNLFTITGPLSPAQLGNVVYWIEQHVDWIADCLSYMRQSGYSRIEVDAQAEGDWLRQVQEAAASAVQSQTDNWYVGANIPGKPRAILVYTGDASRYRQICEAVHKDGYRGFVLS